MRKRVPKAVNDIILEIGLTYRPLAGADQEAHAAKMELLALRVADIPANWLKIAADKWITENRYPPSPADLVRLAKDAQSRGSPVSVSQDATTARDDRERDQAQHSRTLAKLWDREIPEHELTFVPEWTFRSAIAQGSCLLMRNGARRYRTADTIDELARQMASFREGDAA